MTTTAQKRNESTAFEMGRQGARTLKTNETSDPGVNAASIAVSVLMLLREMAYNKPVTHTQIQIAITAFMTGAKVEQFERPEGGFVMVRSPD